MPMKIGRRRVPSSDGIILIDAKMALQAIDVAQCPAGVLPEDSERERHRDGRLHAGKHRGVWSMLDVFMLVIGIGFFALSIGYALACERL
jgi:hypothetical protein